MANPSPHELMSRLESIEQDIAKRQNGLETYGAAYYDAKRDVELALAKVRLSTEGTEQTRKDRALEVVSQSDDYVVLVEAEARYEGSKAAMKALETRASILQSLLKAMSQGGA